MNGQSMIIADKDARYRNRMANYFCKAGYRVEATGSAEKVLNSVLEKETAVLLLGSNVCEDASLADLIELLKVCNSKLHIILVPDELTLDETRQVREAGIFYQALKPASADDTDELRQAVTCAFEDLTDSSAAATRVQAALTEATFDLEVSRAQIVKALSWVAGVVALTIGAGVLAMQVKPEQSGGSLTIWIFLGFLAMIITNQMLPIFRVKLALESLKEWRMARSAAHKSGK